MNDPSSASAFLYSDLLPTAGSNGAPETPYRLVTTEGVSTVEVDGRLAFRMGMGIRHPADVDAPRGTGRRILFQAVPDRVPGKNKMHLDLNVGPDRIETEVARLAMLGAVEQYKVDEPGAFHTTMADPEGNLFCVQ